MTKHKTTIFINISLLLLVIMSGVVAAYLCRLPAHSLRDTTLPSAPMAGPSEGHDAKAIFSKDSVKAVKTGNIEMNRNQKSAPARDDVATSVTFPDADMSRMRSAAHPFAKEAKKVLDGNLSVSDSLSRRKILNYCEHFRMAYTTKDIDFIKQVLCDDALIIVGHTVKTKKDNSGISLSSAVKYNIRSKHEYIKNLSTVFAANKKISVDFSDFKIMRHPTMEGIYGVTIHQKYQSDLYSDDGFLFLLWDFRNPSMPQIHVRTWQPSADIADEYDIIGIGDFNLE